MKTNRLFVLAATSLLMLSACGGGQGGSEASQTSQTSQSSQTSQTSTSTSEAGSTSSEPTSTSTSAPSTSESAHIDPENIITEPTTITVWSTYNDTYQAILNACVDELQTLYPNITVNNVKQQGSYDDLKNMCISGFAVDNYPDLVAAYPDSVADFINNAKALNVEDLMNDPTIGWTEDDFEDIPTTYITAGQQYSIPGTYSLPAAKSTEALYYNQDVLIGLNLSGIDPTINKGKPLNDAYLKNLTWEELFDKLVPALDLYDQGLDEKNKIIDRTTYDDWAWVGYDSDDNFFITLAEQYDLGYTSINKVTGKGQILFNNDGMKDLMKKFRGYYDKHYFTTKGIIQTNVNYRSTVDAMLFSIGSTGGVKYQFSSDNPHNVGVGHLPVAEDGYTSVISQGPDFAFLDHRASAREKIYDNNRAKATWLFYKLFTSFKYNVQWATTTGYTPIRYSVMESAEYQDYSDYASKEDKTLDRLYALNASYSGKVVDDLFTSPVFKGSSEARNQVGTIFSLCAASTNLDADIDGIFQTAVDNTILKM